MPNQPPLPYLYESFQLDFYFLLFDFLMVMIGVYWEACVCIACGIREDLNGMESSWIPICLLALHLLQRDLLSDS
jgi:hypothetical protein